MKELTFKELLAMYEEDLAYARRMKEPENLAYFERSEDYWNGYIQSSFKFFQNMKDFCEDSYPEIRYEITDEERKQYDTREGFPLCGIIDYRDQQIPVYDDDYGQSMFAVINGEEIGGGTYNLFPEMDFEYMMDRYLDLGK